MVPFPCTPLHGAIPVARAESLGHHSSAESCTQTLRSSRSALPTVFSLPLFAHLCSMHSITFHFTPLLPSSRFILSLSLAVSLFPSSSILSEPHLILYGSVCALCVVRFSWSERSGRPAARVTLPACLLFNVTTIWLIMIRLSNTRRLQFEENVILYSVSDL
jgi:hypothetical protein